MVWSLGCAPMQCCRLNLDVVENLAYVPDVTISGAYFSRVPTRGILMTTRGKVVIENNVIHTPMRQALHIADDADSWYVCVATDTALTRCFCFVVGNINCTLALKTVTQPIVN